MCVGRGKDSNRKPDPGPAHHGEASHRLQLFPRVVEARAVQVEKTERVLEVVSIQYTARVHHGGVGQTLFTLTKALSAVAFGQYRVNVQSLDSGSRCQQHA